MPASEVPPLGDRIRTERLRRDLSLRALAREVGVSASMISQIETGKAQPSVSTLYAITTILGLSIQEVFEAAPVDGAAPAVVPRPTTVLDVRGRRLGPLVRPDTRQVLTLDSGVVWERLGCCPAAGSTSCASPTRPAVPHRAPATSCATPVRSSASCSAANWS